MTLSIAFMDKHTLIRRNDRIIVGLSGGPDSVFLLHALHQMRNSHSLFLIAAHLNHESRPESNDDAQFCRQLCAQLDIPIIVEQLSNITHSVNTNGSREALWRAARRHLFERIAHKHNAHSIALGHHQHDQVETFFIRLIRGSSLAGLSGMKPRDGQYIRPLLDLDKETIVAALDAQGIAYQQDASNDSDAFLRNRIRSQVLPALAACDDRFAHNISTTMKRLHEADTLLQQCAREYLSHDSHGYALKTVDFLAAPAVLQQYALTNWLVENKVPFTPSQGLFAEIIRFLKQPGSGTHTLYAKWRVVKKKERAVIHTIS